VNSILTLLALSFPLTGALASKPIDSKIDRLNKDGYEYVTTAGDGTIYFAKRKRRISDTVLIDLVEIDSPSSDGLVESIQVYNCIDKTYKFDGKWKPILAKTIGTNLFNFACS
tara:strand:+ start:6490 stop:6828 length:339 start_codon:yes stop_codon:yes gene_type:complete